MATLFELYSVALLASTVLIGYITVYAWRKRDKTGSVINTVLLLDIFVWCASALVLPVAPNEAASTALLYVTHSAVMLIGPLWLFFVLEFSGRERWLSRRNIGLLLLPSTAVVAVIWTNWVHGLYMTIDFVDTYYLVEIAYGPLFYAYIPYNYALVLIADLILVGIAVNSEYRWLFRKQAGLLLLSGLPAVAASVLYTALNLNFDPTSVSFSFTAVVILFAILREDYLDIVPIARKTVMDEIDNGVVVVDGEEKVTDINSAASDMLGVDDVVGERLDGVVEGSPGFRRAYEELLQTGESGSAEVEVGEGADAVYYKVSVTPLLDDRGRLVGHVYVVNDITEQKERERRLEAREQDLERQNERLDQFAGIVSHDLRNPLSVAEGYSEMADRELREALDTDALETVKERVREAAEHVGVVRESQERMSQIIEDALMLARQGKAITETEQVGVREAAGEAWNNIDSRGATVEIDADLEVEADPNRLLNVFENLFRNAVEHGGDDVSVRVGEVDGGFYVEDDGPGIPPDLRSEVTDHGYTTGEDGLGFGLSIVEDIVEAHGWTLDVGESESGGARFEVLGVDAGGPEVEKTRA